MQDVQCMRTYSVSHTLYTCMNLAYPLSPQVYLTGIQKVMGLIPVRDYDFLFIVHVHDMSDNFINFYLFISSFVYTVFNFDFMYFTGA